MQKHIAELGRREAEFLVASELVQPSAILYWTAIRHWNWTEQIAGIVYVQTTKKKINPHAKGNISVMSRSSKLPLKRRR